MPKCWPSSILLLAVRPHRSRVCTMPDGGHDQFDGVIRLTEALARGAGIASSGRRKQKSSQQQDRGMPIVRVSGGLLPSVIDRAEAILIDQDKELFQRGDLVVRPAPAMVHIADDRK